MGNRKYAPTFYHSVQAEINNEGSFNCGPFGIYRINDNNFENYENISVSRHTAPGSIIEVLFKVRGGLTKSSLKFVLSESEITNCDELNISQLVPAMFQRIRRNKGKSRNRGRQIEIIPNGERIILGGKERSCSHPCIISSNKLENGAKVWAMLKNIEANPIHTRLIKI